MGIKIRIITKTEEVVTQEQERVKYTGIKTIARVIKAQADRNHTHVRSKGPQNLLP